jgi:tetratricopeptide (TPR) repeat protein
MHTFSTPFLLWDDAARLLHDKPGVYGAERIYYNRGTELGKLKRYDEAIADLGKAIVARPDLDAAYGNRAGAYYFQGKYREALRDYDSAIALNRNIAESYYGRAVTYRALGEFEAAQEDFRKSCALGFCPKAGEQLVF